MNPTSPDKWDEILDDLTNLRILAHMAQRDVAEELGIARTTVTNWERGRFPPSVKSFLAWLDVLGVDMILVPREDR